MIKRFIITLFCILYLSMGVFAIDKPQINSIEKKDNYWTLQGSGFNDYDKLYYYFEDSEVKIKKYHSDEKIDILELESFTNGEFYLKGEVYSGSEGQSINSSNIKVYKPIDYYIEKITKSYSDGKYTLKLSMANRDKDEQSDFNIYINDKLIESSMIEDKGYEILIDYEDFYKYNKVNISLKDNEKYISTKSFDLANKIGNFNLISVKREDDKLTASFSVRGSNNLKVFLDDKELSTSDFGYIGSNTFVYFDVNDNIEKHSIYMQINEKTTKKIYIDLGDYVKPTIKSFIMTKGNRKLYENHIVGKNLEGELEDIKIKINDKEYKVRKQNYGYWYTKISNEYEGKLEGLVGDEKQDVVEDRTKAYETLEDYLYDFDQGVNGEKFLFTQRFFYNTGSINTIELTIGDKISNEISFTATESREEQKYSADGVLDSSNKNLSIIFTPIESSTGSYYDNKEFKLGVISLSEGKELDYAINSISLDLELEGEELDYMPIEYIKLGDFRGYVFPSGEDDNKYVVSFENIKLIDFDSNDYDLKIKLSDNYNDVIIKLIPTEIDYYIINGSNEMDSVNEDIVYDNGLVFQNDFVYVPCFDIDSDYKNCKAIGYEDKTRYNWAIGTTEDSVELKKEDSENTGIYVLTDKDKAAITIFMSKLDKYVDSKSKGNEKIGKLIYGKINSLIEAYYIKLEDGRKKEIIGEIITRIEIIIK